MSITLANREQEKLAELTHEQLWQVCQRKPGFAALHVKTVRFADLRYFVSQLHDALLDGILHDNRLLQLMVQYQHATVQCRHGWVSYSRRASAFLFLHQTPLSLCSLFTSLLGVARWQLLANRHLASGRHEGCGATP